MAFVTDIQHGGFIDRIAASLKAYRIARQESAAKQRLYRETLSELKGLSNRELADIGIHPSQIESMAFEAAFGK